MRSWGPRATTANGSPTCSPRWSTPRTEGRKTLGHQAARIAAELGTPYMPWQQAVADVALEIDPETGRLAYREVRLTVPRQSGKTTGILSITLHRALGSPRQNIAYAAQTAKDARKKWEDDWLPILDASRFSSFYRKRLANGHEGLIFRNGSRQGLLANTEKSGHGGTLDLGFSDEAFALPDARLEQAAKPAMITRPQPQFWIVSTAGTPKKSPYLYGKVLSGRQIAERQLEDPDERRGVCYIEYSAPDGADPMSPSTWWNCMPALGYTVTEDAVAADLKSMLDDPEQGLSEFERAYLNRWVLAMGNPVVSLAHWGSLARAAAERPPWVVLGLSVGQDDGHAAVVAAGECSAGLQTSVVAHGEGIDWLFPKSNDPDDRSGTLAEIVERYERPYVLVDEKSCAHLLPEIERVCGFDRVRRIKQSEMPGACAFWLRLAQQSRVFHRDEPELTVALAAAERRIVGDGRVWSQAKSSSDITPLIAQTLAVSFWLGSWGD